MNNWSIIGRCGSDGELRTTKSGTQLLTFTVAVDSGWGDNKKVEWIRVTKFGKGVGGLCPFVRKGDRIGVVGEGSKSEYTNKDGETKSNLEIVAHTVTLCGDGTKKAASGQEEPANAVKQGSVDIDDDDIPF